MTAISLREAAKQLRDEAHHRRIVARASGGGSLQMNILAAEHDALATLLDGDGEGGLLGRHRLQQVKIATEPHDEAVSRMWEDENYRHECDEHCFEEVTKCAVCGYGGCGDRPFVAAYVSAVLGTTVEA